MIKTLIWSKFLIKIPDEWNVNSYFEDEKKLIFMIF